MFFSVQNLFRTTRESEYFFPSEFNIRPKEKLYICFLLPYLPSFFVPYPKHFMAIWAQAPLKSRLLPYQLNVKCF